MERLSKLSQQASAAGICLDPKCRPGLIFADFNRIYPVAFPGCLGGALWSCAASAVWLL